MFLIFFTVNNYTRYSQSRQLNTPGQENQMFAGRQLQCCVVTVFSKLLFVDHPLSAAVRERLKERKCKNCIRHWTNENSPIYVCAETAFGGWPLTESRRICSSHNFFSFNRYFRKHFKFSYIKGVVMVILTSVIMFLVFICIQFWVLGILRRWSTCTLTAYEMVRNCR
jgi:hypothetical protein